MDRVDAERHDRRQCLAACFGAAMVFVHPPARVERHAEPIASLQHQPVEPCGIDAGLWIAGADLTGGDIGRGIDRKVCRDRQFGEVYVLAFDDPLLPGRAVDTFNRPVILAALSEGCGEGAGVYPHCGGDQAPIAGEIGDDRHIETLDVFEYNDRTTAGAFELEDCRGDVELASDRCADPHQLFWILALDHRQEAAHALRVHRVPPPITRPDTGLSGQHIPMMRARETGTRAELRTFMPAHSSVESVCRDVMQVPILDPETCAGRAGQPSLGSLVQGLSRA